MRRFGLLFFLVLTPGIVCANCTYVRTDYKKLTCKPGVKTNEDFPELAVSTTTLPGLEETPVGPLDELTCECTYVLQGSNPLCDSDREQDFSQTYPKDAAAPVCSRAKSLCASVCPKKLP